ncbi:hypothetical protein K1T71_010976 [Dendrolimus kikuchii]|uniref:Uncharacterized protein n=1 Tax=Dendrolimus kikuchii TaxID=765133 RepID=A0ACC1CRE1_9NEOP|nr:hypothetical protein K1T71_010976 [Dendrolimus kikuchii]
MSLYMSQGGRKVSGYLIMARRWGAQKNRPAMNYDKLSRSLRYYYENGIMQTVAALVFTLKLDAFESFFKMIDVGTYTVELGKV